MTKTEARKLLGLKARGPIKLDTKGKPLVRVDTHPKNRALDKYDHIINFLEETFPTNYVGRNATSKKQ